MKRKIVSHIASPSTEPVRPLDLYAIGDPGAGGANHEYLIEGFGDGESLPIRFQNGELNGSMNGVTNEVLLSVLIDRLGAFLAGPFPSTETEIAYESCVKALSALQRRTLERRRDHKEGKHVL